jgi:hypothetical protein
MHRDLTPQQLDLIARGLARVDRGYVVPVIRGGSDDAAATAGAGDQGGDGGQGDPGADGGQAAGAPPAGDAGRTFSQADVDRIVQERLARAKTTPPADYEDLKQKAAKLDEIEKANQTELERAQARAAELEQREQRAKQTLIEAAVLAEGTRQQAIKPEHLHRLIDLNEVTVGDDGRVTGVSEAVKAFLDTNPEYVGTARAAGSADQGARGSSGVKQLTEADLKTMTPDQIVKAHEEGRMSALLGVK